MCVARARGRQLTLDALPALGSGMRVAGTPEQKGDSNKKQKPRPMFTAPDPAERSAMQSWYESPGTMKLGAGSDQVGDVPLFLDPPCICYWYSERRARLVAVRLHVPRHMYNSETLLFRLEASRALSLSAPCSAAASPSFGHPWLLAPRPRAGLCPTGGPSLLTLWWDRPSCDALAAAAAAATTQETVHVQMLRHGPAARVLAVPVPPGLQAVRMPLLQKQDACVR